MILVSLILTIGFHEALTYPKFIGGENANLGQFPYQVTKKFFCENRQTLLDNTTFLPSKLGGMV